MIRGVQRLPEKVSTKLGSSHETASVGLPPNDRQGVTRHELHRAFGIPFLRCKDQLGLAWIQGHVPGSAASGYAIILTYVLVYNCIILIHMLTYINL